MLKSLLTVGSFLILVHVSFAKENMSGVFNLKKKEAIILNDKASITPGKLNNIITNTKVKT